MSPHRHAILLVDDYADARDSMETLIGLEGFAVVGVPNAAEALAQLRGPDIAWCLIVLDWRLPDMTGGHFHEVVAADPKLAHIPVLVVTADSRGAAEARRIGVRHVALKPIETRTLLEVIRQHCSRSAA